MFEFFLATFAFSVIGRITSLTGSNFEKFVEKRKKSEIWIVMFHTPKQYYSDQIYPDFVQISKNASGMFKFGLIDTKSNPLLCRRFSPKSQPYFLIFHSKGQTEYIKSYDSDELLEFASNFLQDLSVEVDYNFLQEKVSTKAILFTNHQETPSIWKGFSNIFSSKKN